MYDYKSRLEEVKRRDYKKIVEDFGKIIKPPLSFNEQIDVSDKIRTFMKMFYIKEDGSIRDIELINYTMEHLLDNSNDKYFAYVWNSHQKNERIFKRMTWLDSLVTSIYYCRYH
jgi:hypothetical protein